MKIDKNELRIRLLDYLIAKGTVINTNKSNPIARCINPSHDDQNPSMTIYNEHFNCNSCGCKGDIFDAAGFLTGSKEFKDQREEVEKVLLIAPKIKTKITKKKDALEPIITPLKHDLALKKYSTERVLDLANFVINAGLEDDHPKYRKLIIPEKHGWFPYYDKNGDIDLMVVRFEDEEGKKEILSFYYNGKNVAMKSYPTLLFNRHILAKSEKPIIIHEGEKSINDAEEKLPWFTHTAWNGGGKKYQKIQDLEILKDREIFIFGDDDKPGQLTAVGLKKFLKTKYQIDSILIPPFKKAREIKKKGADIEEVLQSYQPEEIKNIIFSLRIDLDRKESDHKPEEISGSTFEILGIGEDGRAYFLDYEKRMISHELSSLTQNKLIDIAGLQFFITKCGGDIPKKDDWITGIDTIMHISKRVDFDLEKCKGRGAWKNKKGDICYHDGKKTIGKYEKDSIFLRKPRHDIGLKSEDCEGWIRKEIMKISKKFSFATPSDAIRLLSHAALSPFGGALTWRPSILVTGESGSGKTTVINNVARPISLALAVNGGATTEAAIRQYNANDSSGISIDEAEATKPKDRERIEDIFSLMRGSTSDDSPKTLKGSSSGKATSFTMKSMFCFAAVNASINNVADDNRIIKVNFKKMNNFMDYTKNMAEVKTLLSAENCNGIRAFTWRNLKKIIELGERLEIIIQTVTGQDARYAAGESILLAANLIVWEDFTSEVADKELESYVKTFYTGQVHEESRDEISEMINRILDETLLFGSDKIKISFRELLTKMKQYLDFLNNNQKWSNWPDGIINKHDYQEYKKTIEHYGLSVQYKTKELAIAQNHHEIIKILQSGKGYHRQFERHETVIKKQVVVTIDSSSKKCTIIGGFLNYEKEEE